MALNLERARRRLMAVGIEDDRADAIADVVGDATDDLATKQDIADLRAELYRALWRWGVGLVVAGTALLAIQTAIQTAIILALID